MRQDFDPSAAERDLARWIPRLLALWRSHRLRPKGPVSRLTPGEYADAGRGVRTLSAGLTRDRSLLGGRYWSDPSLLGAYLLYYWPISYLQTRFALQDLPLRPRAVLDVGSGPGPAGAAAFDLGAQTVTFTDRSPVALAMAGALAGVAGKKSRLRSWNAEEEPYRWPEESYDLILMVHVLNELWAGASDRVERRAQLCARLAKQLRPGGAFLVLEPALTSTSRDLLAVRDRLLALGFSLLAPCLWLQACPAAANPQATCHTELRWNPPAFLRHLIRQADFKKITLKMTAFLFTPRKSTGPPRNAGWFRIVSEPMRSKNNRLRLLGCGPAGRLSLALKLTQVSPSNRVFLHLRRGDLIRVRETRPRPGGLDLTRESVVEIAPRSRAAG